MTAPRPHPPLSALAPTEVWDRLDPLAPDLALNPDGLGTLPYGQLKGPGFERLCYELLLAQGLMPRFFGRSGQADYGVDIIVEQAQTLSVFQCKNLAAPPSWQAISQAVQTFESDWLHHAGLPRPTRFVYCCPHPLDEQKLGATWTEFRQAFIQRTGIELHFWDRHSLDAQLRGLPVIVAGVFSASYAEHFCPHSHDWRHAPWIRVQRNQARHAVVQRFLQQHDADKLYIADHEAELFAEILSQHGVLVIRGLPGSGKTSLTLALASRQRHLYYASLRDASDVDKLWQSALQRLKLPSVFFLDDCHVNLTLAGALLERLAPEWRKGQLHLVLGLRDHPTDPNAGLDDTPDWLRELQDNQQVLNLKPDRQRTRAVAEHLRQDLIGLSAARLDALHHGSSGDLLLLDELLSNIRAPSELDTLQLAGVLPKLHQRYFGARTRLPTVQRLAALAQFDLAPQADYFTGHWQDQEKPRLAGLITELFSPPRYQFLHASLAELVLHALIQLEAPEATRTHQVRQHTVDSVLRYLDYLRAQQSGADAVATLNLVLRTRLKLCSPAEDAGLKAQLLAAPTVLALVREQLAMVPFGMFLGSLRSLAHAQHTAQSDYVDLLCARLDLLFNPTSHDGKRPDILHIGFGLYALRRFAPARWEALWQQHPPAAFMQLLLDQGEIVELFKVLVYAPVEFRAALLAQLDAAQAERLLNKTISAGRSIGTLSLAMRELNNTDPALLAGLEQAIGAPGWMRLIDANGTVFELFKVLERATPEFRAVLLAQLDAAQAERLLNKTIRAGRSIGTLHLAMRELNKTDPTVLAGLEQAIGAPGWMRLIDANGTLFELFGILQYATPEFRPALLAQLDAAQAERLLNKTINAGRSIGTLNLAMRELNNSDPTVLAGLEQAIGAPGWMRLIDANGTLLTLFKVLERATPEFRPALLAQLNAAQAERLLNKTISTGRSIGTLHLAMRELNNSDSALLAGLEQAIGAPGWMRLIDANGTLLTLFKVLECATPEFRPALLAQLDAQGADALVSQTICAGRAIESLDKSMGVVTRNPALRQQLERCLGAKAWWRLVLGVGTLYSLQQLSQLMSEALRQEMAAAAAHLTTADWRALLTRGQLRNACAFISQALPDYPPAAQAAFVAALADAAEALAQQASWFDLNLSQAALSAAAHSPAAAELQRALATRIAALHVAELEGLDFKEACNGLAFAWRERPDLRQALAAQLWRILPPPAQWLQAGKDLAAIGWVLNLACDPSLAQDEALRLRQASLDSLADAKLAQFATLPLFLLLWHLAALTFERCTPGVFACAMPPALIDRLIAIVQVRALRRSLKEEHLSEMALAGVLLLLFPVQAPRLHQALAPLRSMSQHLQNLALAETFVPAFFALKGIALIDRGCVLTSMVRMGLLFKAKAHEPQGPALAFLRQSLS